MAYVGKNPGFNSVILLDETGTPANPPSGKTKLVTYSGVLRTRNSSGTELSLAARGTYVAKSGNYTILDNDGYNLIACTAPSTTFDFVDGDINTGADTIGETSHGLSDGDVIHMHCTVRLPAGLSAIRPYYVVSSAANTFKVALTPGGSAVDITAAASGGTHSVYKGLVVTLPTAADNTDREITIKKVDANVNFVVIEGESSETIDGQNNIVLRGQYASVTLKCDGTNWRIMAASAEYSAPILYKIGNSTSGPVYNGVALNCTGSNWVPNAGWFMPYQDAAGGWHLRFNFNGNFSSGTAASFTITLAGVTCRNAVRQAFTAYDHGGTNLRPVAGVADSNAGTLNFRLSASATIDNEWSGAGDLALESKPTWAY